MFTTCFIVLTVSLFSYEAHAQCRLTREQIEGETRIATFQNLNGALELLRTDTVPLGTRLFMICGEEDVVSSLCSRNGRFSRKLPIGDCDNPIKATPELVADSLCPYEMYRVGYRINEDQFLELYRSCYQRNRVHAHFTMHTAHSFSVVTDRPQSTFVTDRLISGAEAATFEASAIYNRFRSLLGVRQRYIRYANQIVFDRGHLVPSADFLFVNNMRATFKYINVIPQFSSINRGNWKTIENWVRRRLTVTPQIDIITGVFGVLQLQDATRNKNMVSMYLDTNFKNVIPMWIYKIVTENNERTLFITYNNASANKCPRPACKIIDCPSSINLNEEPEYGFTYCCDVSQFNPTV